MKIQKIYQGTVPDNKILNDYSDSSVDTYSCNTINNIINSLDCDSVPMDAIIDYDGDIVPEGYELVENVPNDDKLEFICVTASQNRTLGKQSPVVIPYDTITSDHSNGKLKLENESIVIGEGVKCVRVTAQVGVQSSSTGYDMKSLGLYKNNVEVCIVVDMCYNAQYSVATPCMSRIVDVEPGDTLTLKSWYQSVNTVSLTNAWNYWSVEIVECAEPYAEEVA